MGQGLSQGEHRLAACEGLIRIAQKPQVHGDEGQPQHAGLEDEEVGRRRVPRRVVKGQGLFQMRASRVELAETEQGSSQRPMGVHEQGRVLRLLGQRDELLRQLARGRQFPRTM